MEKYDLSQAKNLQLNDLQTNGKRRDGLCHWFYKMFKNS